MSNLTNKKPRAALADKTCKQCPELQVFEKAASVTQVSEPEPLLWVGVQLHKTDLNTIRLEMISAFLVKSKVQMFGRGRSSSLRSSCGSPWTQHLFPFSTFYTVVLGCCPVLSQSWPHPCLQWLHFTVGELIFGLVRVFLVDFVKCF